MRDWVFCLLVVAAVCGTSCTTTVDRADTVSDGVNTPSGSESGPALALPALSKWSVSEFPLDFDSFRISLRAQHFRRGGDGEAPQIFKQRALQLQLEKGFSSYRILSYEERIESAIPFINSRVAEGVIQLVK